ncbi:hypothetical protein [Maioricimonas sp. JC845]|uniref:hypothetical protein n=1 Tax=Maioricimonas sp. JC845 TaxID=3232138 RepID=UPI003458557C
MKNLASVLTTLVGLLLLSPGPSVRAADDDPVAAFDLLLDALRNQGANPQLIWSGRATITRTQTFANRDAELQKRVREGTEPIERALKTEQDPQKRKLLQETLEGYPESVAASLPEEGVRSKLRVVFDGNRYDGSKRQEVLFESPASRVSRPSVNVRLNAAPGKGNNIFFNAQANLAHVTRSNTRVLDFQKFGRADAKVLRLLTALLVGKRGAETFEFNEDLIQQIRTQIPKSDRTAYRILGTEVLDGSRTTIVEYRDASSGEAVRVWVDPERGYVTPRIEERSGDRVTFRRKSDGYFRDRHSGLYYPARYVEERFSPESGELIETIVHEVNPEDFALNVPIDPSEFAVEVPAGTVVLDEINGGDNYTATGPATLQFDNGQIDLAANPALTQSAQGLPMQMVAPGADGGGPSWLWRLVAVNVVVLLLLLAAWSLRRRRRKTAGDI